MRVLVVDDHEVVRRGVKSLLLSQSNYNVCGEAVDGQDALEKASLLKPDVVVMDVSMPNLNGLEATRLIRSLLVDTEVLILSQHESPEMVRQAFKAGARGYVVKSSISRDLLNALDNVSRHQPFFDPAIPGIASRAVEVDAQEILQRSAALEKALRRSEELYRSTFEFAELGVAHQSPDGRWLNANDRLCRIVGYSKDELLKMSYRDITHPDDLDSDNAEAGKMRAGLSDSYSTQKRYVRKDGSVIWVSLKVSTVRDPDRRLQYFITVVEDVTERREAEQAKLRLAAIVESSSDAIISKDLTGVINSWNGGAQGIFGFAAEEVIGRPISVIIPQELMGEEADILRRLAKGERIESFETVRMTKAGERLNVSLTISPIKDSKGRVIGASKIARNITDRKRMTEQIVAHRHTEDALRQSEARLRAAFSQTYSFLALLTPDGTILEANDVALQAAGRERDQVVGRKFWEPWWSALPQELAVVQGSIAKAAAGERVGEECYFCLADGSRRFAHRTLEPVLDEDGKVVTIVATGLDMTEQKELRDKLEARVKQRTQELEEKNRALLQQELTVRELSGQLLRAQDEERRRIARELHDSAGQIVAALHMNLLPLEVQAQQLDSKIANGIKQSVAFVQQLSSELRTISYLLHPPLLDEAGLPSALRWYVEGFAERSNIDVQLDLSPDLGRLPADMEVTIFRMVQECLTNIHRHSGGKKAGIRVHRFADGVRLEIQDNGKGMNVSNAGNSSGQSVRAGVGIQGMRERVRQLSGQFEIHSGNSGTMVTANLPLAASAAASD